MEASNADDEIIKNNTLLSSIWSEKLSILGN